MRKPAANPPPGFDDLAVEERIEYLGALWDRIAADPDRVPVPDWHLHIVEKERAAFLADGDRGLAWSQVREELRKEISRSTPDR